MSAAGHISGYFPRSDNIIGLRALRQEASRRCGRASEMLMMQRRSGENLCASFLEVARVSVVWPRKSARPGMRRQVVGRQASGGGGGKRAAALTFCFSSLLESLARPGDLGSLRVAHPAASALFSSFCAQTITRHFIQMLFFCRRRSVRPGFTFD